MTMMQFLVASGADISIVLECQILSLLSKSVADAQDCAQVSKEYSREYLEKPGTGTSPDERWVYCEAIKVRIKVETTYQLEC